MPTTDSTPRKDLDAATAALVSTSIAFAYLNSLPENERAGYVKARIRFDKARRVYAAARDAYLTAYPHRAEQTPLLVTAR